MGRSKLIIIAVLIAVAVFSLWWVLKPEERNNSVVISGNIELTEIHLGFPMTGEIVKLAVEEGDRIEAGSIIARLDDSELQSQRQEALAALSSARSRLKEQDRHIKFLRERLKGEIERQQATLEQARSVLRRLESGSRPQEIKQAEAAYERALAGYRRAEGDWERAQELYSREDISRSDYDAARAAFESAEAALNEARQTLDLVREGPRKEEVEVARARVAQASAGLQLAETGSLEIQENLQARATLLAEIERAEAGVDLIETRIKDAVLIAPIDGTILTKLREEGEVTTAGSAVVTLGDLSNPWLRGFISETDLGRVKLNDLALVTTDSYPGKVYRGRVSFIASEAEFTPRQIETREQRVRLVYRIKIVLQNPDQELKLNMPADAEIILDTESNS